MSNELRILILKSPEQWLAEWKENNKDKTVISFSHSTPPVKGGYYAVDLQWEAKNHN